MMQWRQSFLSMMANQLLHQYLVEVLSLLQEYHWQWWRLSCQEKDLQDLKVASYQWHQAEIFAVAIEKLVALEVAAVWLLPPAAVFVAPAVFSVVAVVFVRLPAGTLAELLAVASKPLAASAAPAVV